MSPLFTLPKAAASAASVATVIAAAALASLAPLAAQADIPAPVIAQAPTAGGVPTLAPLVKSLLPAVVNIQVSSKVQIQNPLLNDPFFRRFFNIPDQPQTREMQAIGSGVIVDAEKGYVITNNHVVAKADKVRVRLNDDRILEAKVLGTDPETDVAVLQVKGSGLKSMPMGDSDKLQVGDFVLAIGSPFNLSGTVTSGIVSALGRSTGDGGIEDFIQTDASINPGNSGGALVNLHGELVGINSQILSGSGGSIGIGFAIPIDLVKTVMTQLIEHGKIERGLIGVVGGQELTPELAKEFGLKNTHGALVGQVVPGSAAAKAGIQPGDVIVEANGKQVDNFAQLHNIVGLLSIGADVKLKLVRNGQVKNVNVTVGKRKEIADEGGSAIKGLHPALKGAEYAWVDEASGADVRGVRVVSVQPGSPADDAGLQPDDVIVAVNRKPLTSLKEFIKMASAKDANLLLQVQRGPGTLFLLLQP
jgi:serine protease Do/serine protease DegQ